ncbi:hypothetical protein SAMN05216359_106101 [Roseateles sp. YR242]|uniref:hypothetical protein n=1 Tax=Roseateles sp. YR242 TaxID=1855305 RepID=UPI0008D6EACE|nr:hypothetical protein [Roseateles sp. YR242]SEL19586.1 hypothetical protein SAMN05216359_106101 [Roseateles sp. YR242]
MSSRPPLPPEHPADESVLDPSVSMQHVSDQPLDQSAFVCGEVTYRTGDGPMLQVRQGPIQVSVAEHDVTLGWEEEDNRMSAVMPRSEYARFVGSGAIKPVVPHRASE